MQSADSLSTRPDHGEWRTVAAGFLALALAMGVGRFAYTSILPFMLDEAHVSKAVAGYLASGNYLGYLVGAFAAGAIPWVRRHRLDVARTALLTSVVTTGAMALTSAVWGWFTLRTVSGVASGLAFVLVSSTVLDVLLARGRTSHIGVFYGGVGFGIAVTGLTVPLLASWFSWRGAWLGMMVFTVVIGVPIVLWLKEGQSTAPAPAAAAQHGAAPSGAIRFPWLVAAYGCEGLGYIITGTFLPAMVSQMSTLHASASYSWVMVGMAALPSCIVWSVVSQRFGAITALMSAYMLQMVGVVLPVVFPVAAGVDIGAILFGGTFMGITTTATTVARTLGAADSSQAIGLMTGVYGIGQIAGAAGAGVLANLWGDSVRPRSWRVGCCSWVPSCCWAGESARHIRCRTINYR
ncbi:MFS transporter [Alicyclobacillus contaminans]|nr:MFS transporter [Alicyclobacillus contaminans]